MKDFLKRKGKVLFMFLFLAGLQAMGQTSGPKVTETASLPVQSVIKGKVVENGTNQAMEYANISIFSSRDSSLITGGITDVNGEFRIGNLVPGTFYVEANFIGFNKTRINNVRITPNNRQIELGVIELEPATEEIGAVEVVADRARVEYKIDKKIINVAQDINAAGGTAVDVLENTPSIQVDIEGNVTLRGSSSFTVFIDGRPSVLSGSDALQQIPASALETIEIITNPSVKYDPDGNAGIINLVMKKNILSGFNGVVNTMIGTGDKRRIDLTVNHKTKKRNLSFGIDNNHQQFSGENESTRETFLNDNTEYLIMKGDRSFTRKGFGVKGGVDFYLSDKTTLGFMANAGQYNSSSLSNGLTHHYTVPLTLDEYTVNTESSERKNDYVSGNINFLHKYNEDGSHKLEGLFNYRYRNGDDVEFQSEIVADANFQPTDIYDLQIRTTEGEESNDYRMKLDYTRSVGPDGKLEAGWQSRLDRETEDYLFEDFDPETQQWVNNSNFSSRMDFKRDIHSVYSTFSNKMGPVEYMAGLRGEYTDREIQHAMATESYKLDRFDLFPSLHLSYELFDKSQLMTSYSRRINRPGGRDLDPFPSYMNQYSIRIGNPALEPEYTDSFDLSYMKRFGRSFISLEGFYRVTNNLITRLNQLGDDGILYMTSDNLNSDSSLGGELMANLNLTEWLLLNTSVSVYNYKLDGEVLGQSVNRESTNVDGRLNGTIKFSDNSRMQLMGMYRGPSVSAQGDNKGMFFSNISYRQDFMNKKLTATLSLRDAFGSAKHEGSSSGTNFNSTYKFKREPRVFTLTLSYKINNYKMDRSDSSSDTNEMDFEEGGF
ncbi:TonB-dependent receptor domain-containing protein [Gaoshiqia sediminis]|uniref:TonB-dependent receptor n=1 Tax=Gaoshiqia sediminis TaxID=2986998 RepID=A0AA42C9N6_9BACT|nr:TonB-dependent receptor [Gaoshiqia sediminis]MCW0484231.1 TonB-dependent receptor [Gaoshiqia sediminis]